MSPEPPGFSKDRPQPAVANGPPPSRGWRRAARAGGILVPVLLLVVQTAWLYSHTAAATEDSVTFISIARCLGGEGEAPNLTDVLADHPAAPRVVQGWPVERWPALLVVAQQDQHPGFPLAILAVRRAVGDWLAPEPAWQWLRSAQLVSLAAGPVLMVGVFLLGRQLLGFSAGLIAAILLASCRAVTCVCSGALSDAPALAFLVLSAYFGARLLQEQRTSVRTALACGLCGAAAYWFRPEGLQIVALLVLFLAGSVAVGPAAVRRRALVHLLAVGLPVLLWCGPYVLLKGSCLTKNLHVMVEPIPAVVRDVPNEAAARLVARGARRFVDGWVCNVGWPILALTGLGLFCYRRHGRGRPDHALIASALLLNGILLPAVFFPRRGYLDHRHVLPAVCLASVWAALGLLILVKKLRSVTLGASIARAEQALAAAALACCAISGAKATVQWPLHGERNGFRMAGEWLRDHDVPADCVLDPEGLAGFFAGRAGFSPWPPKCPDLSAAIFGKILNLAPTCDWLVLSQSYLERHGSPTGPPRLESYRMTAEASFPASLNPDHSKQIWIYRISPVREQRTP